MVFHCALTTSQVLLPTTADSPNPQAEERADWRRVTTWTDGLFCFCLGFCPWSFRCPLCIWGSTTCPWAYKSVPRRRSGTTRWGTGRCHSQSSHRMTPARRGSKWARWGRWQSRLARRLAPVWPCASSSLRTLTSSLWVEGWTAPPRGRPPESRWLTGGWSRGSHCYAAGVGAVPRCVQGLGNLGRWSVVPWWDALPRLAPGGKGSGNPSDGSGSPPAPSSGSPHGSSRRPAPGWWWALSAAGSAGAFSERHPAHLCTSQTPHPPPSAPLQGQTYMIINDTESISRKMVWLILWSELSWTMICVYSLLSYLF